MKPMHIKRLAISLIGILCLLEFHAIQGLHAVHFWHENFGMAHRDEDISCATAQVIVIPVAAILSLIPLRSTAWLAFAVLVVNVFLSGYWIARLVENVSYNHDDVLEALLFKSFFPALGLIALLLGFIIAYMRPSDSDLRPS